ncbi:flagellar basal body rod protein FlgC [Pinirhizobacter sp.]|jgi:flagellar basal-body rod protein FlgC|uniref:flagellar basal body rod protein FlgC n=1 Tax=Pinirhizobacter sp. TaxID=2950432 RepID=UPI002F3FADD1
MSTESIFAITRFGLDTERARMETASMRIASSDVPLAKRLAASTGQDFADKIGAPVSEQDGHPVLDPANPAAAADGTVSMPSVDLAQEMTNLMSAQRAYEADIRAFNTLHGMLMKSLDIGR